MPKLINVPGVGRVPVPDDYTFEQILDLREQLQKKSGIEPDLTPQFGLGELLGRGFERGVERFKIGFGDVLPAMVGSAFGNEEYAKRQMEEAAASEQALQERLPARYQSYQDVKSLADVPGYVVETIGESAPDVLTSLLPGGVGATVGRIGAQQAARQALMGAARQGAAREVAVKAAQEAAEKSATRGMLAGTYLGSYAQNAPEVFQNIYQETGEFNPTVAALYGGLSAALDSILPAKVLDQLGTVGKGALIREMVKSSGADPKVWQTIGKGVAKGFATEGLTESAQEFVNNLAVKTLKENYDLFSPENVTRYIDSFLRGAIVGGGISLPSSTLQAVRERNLIKAKEQEEAAKVAEGERVKSEEVAAQQKLDQENQILSQIPEGIEPVKVGEDIFTIEKTGAVGDLIPRGYIVSGVQDRQVDTLDEAEALKAAMESTREDDIKNQEEERTKLIEKLAKLDEQLDQKQKDVINVSKEDFEAFRDKTYPEQSGKLNEQIAIKDQILDRLNKPIEIKPLEEQVAREADEYTTFKRTPEGQQAISRHVSPEEAKERLFKPAAVEQAVEQVAEPVAEPPAEPQLVGKEEVTGQPLEELRKELDRLGLPEVGVKLYNALLGQGTPVDGAFAEQTINIAMNPATRTRIQTLHHEVIHALKEAGLFTAGEWKALSTAAKKDWIKRKWPDLQGKTVADLYADQSPEIQIEEAVAVAFEHYMKKAFSPAGQVSSAFQKIANFFGRIRSLFTGKGYQTADDVFEFISSGAMRYKIRPGEVSIGPTKFARAAVAGAEEFKNRMLAKFYYADDQAANNVADYFVNMPIDTLDQGMQKLGDIISYPDSKTLVRKVRLLQTYRATKQEDKADNMLKDIQEMIFNYGAPFPLKGRYKDLHIAANLFYSFVKDNKPKTDQDVDLTRQTKALYNTALDVAHALSDSKESLPSPSAQDIEEEPLNFFLPSELEEQTAKFNKEKEKAAKPVTVKLGKKEPAFKKPQTILEERLAKYFPDIPEEHRKVFSDTLGDLKIELHNGKVVTNNQLMDDKNIYGIGFTKLIDQYKNAYQDADSTEMSSAATNAAILIYSNGNMDFKGSQDNIVAKSIAFDKTIDPNNITEEQKRIDDFYHMAREFMVELRTAYISVSNVTPLTPTEVNQPSKADFVDKVWSERNWREPWIIKTAQEMAEAFEQQRKEFKHLSVGTPEFNEFMRRTKEKRLMYHATTIRGNVGEGKAWTIFESWRNFICVTTSPWFAKDWRNADTPGAYTYRLVVMTEKPVEFWNEQQVDEILANMPDSAFSSKPRSEFKANVMNGEWVYIESENFVKSAQKLGYDAIYITERNALNMAVFSPTQVKSVVGEAGTYGIRPLTKDEAAKYGLTQAEALKQQKLGNVLFARSPLTDTSQFKNWFKDSKAVEKGEPKLMYHGTSRDITYFMPKQANAIFVTDSPKFAGAFASDSYQWMARHVDEWATPEMKKTAERYAEKLIRNDYQGRTRAEILGQLKRREGEGLDYLTRAYQDMVPIGPNIIPVYVSVQNPFDFDNKDHREKISAALAKLNNVTEGSGIHMRDMRLLANGSWIFIEEANTQKAIRDAGFDGFYVKEGGEKNLAVFDSSQLKSAFNTGAFSPDDRRISFARSPIADMQEAALEKIDAVQSKAQDNGYNLAKSPATAKQGMNVVNQFMNQSPTFGKKVVDRILDMSVNNRSMVYNFLTLEQLADLGKDILPGLTPYYETFQEMAGYRDKQLYYASKIAKRLSDLSRKEPEQTERLADVAHMATIAAFDPDRPGTDKNPEITKLWNGLNGEAKQLYRDMRDFYDNRYKAYRALLQQRIDSAITDKNRKAEVNAKMKQLFETQKVKGPYFPLSRFGQYWVSYNDGVDRFVMFEKRAEAERFAADLNGKGYKDIKAGVKEEYNLNMPVPNSVIKELIDTVDKAGNPQELKRDLWTAYLTMLPEVSMRKHFIPRKGTPGYSNDIQRVFAENTFHGAYNLARLKFAPQFEKAISDMRTTISDANKQGKGNEPGELFNALMKRQNFIMNPTPSNMITEAAGILGFTWFLTAPASAITNLSQNATVAYPVLGARFGFNKAMSEMLGASKLFMSSGERNIDEPFSIIRALEQRVKESSGAEKKAFERELQAMEALMDNGTLTRTQAMDLAAMSDKPSITQNKLNTTLKWVGAMFHGAEVFNRSTTAYAAYRMAFEKTGDQEAAIKEASRLVRRSHFDYSAANKPPILQNDFAKVIFMFKQYGINMTYLLLRESQILLKHVAAKYKGTPLEKEEIERAREARDTLIGTLGITGLFSGVFGLPYPLYLMTMVMANALFGDEEDEIFDAETRFKLWLTDSLGADAADIIAKGPISYLSGADFSERVSANGLIFKDIGRLGPRQAEEVEQKEATMQWLVDVMGPIGGLAMNFSKGLGAMNSGNVYQGIEQMVPLAIANGMKAIRYASEGVLTMKGDPIVEEINSYQSFLRAIGYAPTEIARQLEENTSIRAVESQATLSRKQLLNRFALAVHTGDTDALEDIEAAIERFNDKFEGYEITGETLSQSLKAREAARAEVEHGLRINKRIRDVYERGSRLND